MAPFYHVGGNQQIRRADTLVPIACYVSALKPTRNLSANTSLLIILDFCISSRGFHRLRTRSVPHHQSGRSLLRRLTLYSPCPRHHVARIPSCTSHFAPCLSLSAVPLHSSRAALLFVTFAARSLLVVRTCCPSNRLAVALTTRAQNIHQPGSGDRIVPTSSGGCAGTGMCSLGAVRVAENVQKAAPCRMSLKR